MGATSGGAAAIAVMASIQAQEARETACKTFISSYDAKTANVAEMQEYSSCIQTLYPSRPEGNELLGLQLSFVLIGVMFFCGIYRGFKEGDDGFLMVVITGVVWACFAALGILLVGGTVAAFKYLFM